MIESAENTVAFTVPGKPKAKPRQTRADRYKRRKAVMDYRAWCDFLIIRCGGRRNIPKAEKTTLIEINAFWKIGATYKKKRLDNDDKAAMHGTLKRTIPDPDNIAKAVLDALWPAGVENQDGGDAAIGDIVVRRRWDLKREETEIVIHFED